MIKTYKIPAPAIERLALYARPLEVLAAKGTLVISSEGLAKVCGVHPPQVRKDLAYFGDFGVRGVGYRVTELLAEIKRILWTDREWRMCIVGMGNLGRALAENEGFRRRGYRLVAAFDEHPSRVGIQLPCKLLIEHTSRIREAVERLEIEIGVIATSPVHAQRAADLLVSAGVVGILNFAPVQVRLPSCCAVEHGDFTVNLENLAYHLSNPV